MADSDKYDKFLEDLNRTVRQCPRELAEKIEKAIFDDRLGAVTVGNGCKYLYCDAPVNPDRVGHVGCALGIDMPPENNPFGDFNGNASDLLHIRDSSNRVIDSSMMMNIVAQRLHDLWAGTSHNRTLLRAQRQQNFMNFLQIMKTTPRHGA